MSSYIAAPLLVLTYGVLGTVDGERGPGPVGCQNSALTR